MEWDMNVENKILKAEKLLEENKQDSVLRILRKLDSEKGKTSRTNITARFWTIKKII